MPVVDEKLCSGCCICVNICPVGVYTLEKKNGKYVSVPLHSDKCIHCGACVQSCPKRAISQ